MERSRSRTSLGSLGKPGDPAFAGVKALQAYAQTALASRARGEKSAAYNTFVKELQALRRKLEGGSDEPAAEFSLIVLIEAVRANLTTLQEGSHDTVLTTILGTPLWNCSPAVRDVVLDLTVELMNIRGSFITNCLQVLAG